MSRIYARREDNDQRVLICLKCDTCGATIKPHPEISKSGWTKRGQYYDPSDDRNIEWDYCPDHS